MGIEDVDAAALVNEMMVQTGHRADFRVLKNWADHCGEAFDWYAGAYDGLLWQTPEGEKYDADKDSFVVNRNQYKPYDPAIDHERVFTARCRSARPTREGTSPSCSPTSKRPRPPATLTHASTPAPASW